jgi:hypothetical protein
MGQKTQGYTPVDRDGADKSRPTGQETQLPESPHKKDHWIAVV